MIAGEASSSGNRAAGEARGSAWPVAGVILAAGMSRRMGQAAGPKLLLEIGGKPMLQSVIDAAEASTLSEVIIVLGHRAGEVRGAIDPGRRGCIVVCPDYEEGQSASLRAGIKAAGACDAIAVLLGDQPGVSPELIDSVLEAARRSGSPCARPLYSAVGGRGVPGHPVVLARSLWPRILRLSGDRGARDLLAEHPEWVCEVEVAGPAPLDVDVPADYESLSARSGHKTKR